MRRRLILVLGVVALMMSTAVPAAAASAPTPAPRVALGHPAAGLAHHAASTRVVDVSRLPAGPLPPSRRALPHLSKTGATAITAAATSPGKALPSAPGSLAVPTSAFVMDSDQGDWIGGGQHVTYSEPDAMFEPSVPEPMTFVAVYVSAGPDWWYVNIAAPPGEPLVAGTYDNAVRAAFRGAGQPGLDVNGDGRGCNTLSGKFVVEEVSWNVDGSLATFAATFVQHCDGSTPALYGEIRYESTVAWADKGAEPNSVDFGTTSVGRGLSRSVTLTSTGPGPLHVTGASIAGADASSFTLSSDSCSGATVASGATCVMAVTFNPSTYRGGTSFDATLGWSDDTARGAGAVSLTGEDVPATPTAFATTGGASPIAVTPTFQGAGDPSCSSVLCLEPPDPIVAVGPNHVVEATNVSLRFFDRAGHLLRETALPSFFKEPAGQLVDGDPRIVWDALHGRWVASELSADASTSSVYLAVSTGADPTGTWTVRSWYISGILGDYPGLGVSSDKVALSTNDYDWANGTGGSYLGVDILIFDMAAVMGSSTVGFEEFTTGPTGFTLRPAVARSAGNDLQAIIGLAATPVSLDVGYLRFTGTVAAGTVTATTVSDLTIGATGLPALVDPPTPLALSGSYPPFDARPTDAVWANGTLWFPATTFCVPTGASAARSCGRISAFTTAATPAKVADFVVGNGGVDTFVPGVAIDGDGSAFVGWSQTSATAKGPISTYASFRRMTDAAGTLRPPVTIATGSGAYSGHRWGDYLGISPDPMNSSSAWVPGPASAAAGDWTTNIVRLSEPAPAAGTYHPLNPSRILDTRTGVGLTGLFYNHVARTFQVTGKGGVPAGAIGVTGNLTVTQQSAAGYLFIGPVAMNNPTSSTLNFPLADNRANGVTVALGSGGTLSVTYAGTTGAHTQVIFDVTGYFTADATGSTYHALNPARILDTRTGVGLSGLFYGHAARTFQVTGKGGVPAGAVAVTGNLTVTQQSVAGDLFIGPLATNYPTSSTLNFPLGDNRANGVTVALGIGGKLSVTYDAATTAHTQVIFDVTGYFTADATGAKYHALNPSRILDTRSSIGLSGLFYNHVARTFQVTSVGNVLSGAIGVTGNLTVTQQSAAGYLFIGPIAMNNPTSSTLNFPLADNRANGVTVALGSGGTLSVTYAGTTGAHTQAIFDVTGYFTP